MRNSTVLTQYYLNEALRVLNSGIANPVLQEANKLLEWLRGKQKTTITLPEIYQCGPNSIRDAKKARHLRNILIDHGYALSLTDGAEIEGTMRKEAYEVKV